MAFRIFLPPNLASSAPRDAVAVKIESDSIRRSALPAPLSDWCAGNPPWFLQLNRAQLRHLLAELLHQPVFFWVNKPGEPIAWVEDALPGISEHLAATPPPSAEPPPQPAAAPAPRPTIPARRASAEPLAASARAVPGISERRAAADAAGLTPPMVDGSEHYLAITLPSREHPAYSEILELLKADGFRLEPSNRKWWLRDRHKTLNFLAEYWEDLRDRLGAQFTPNFYKNTAHLAAAQVSCQATEQGAGYDVRIAIKAGSAEEPALRRQIAGGKHYVDDNGSLILINPRTLRRIEEVQRALSGEAASGPLASAVNRIGRDRAAEVQELIESIDPSFQPPETWLARSEALRNLSRLKQAPVPAELDGRLRLYQRIGAAWLYHLYQNRLGGILADEMGLGKTIQALALLTAIQEAERSPAPSLVVCPASLVENWRREAARFAPGLRTFAHHGEFRLDSVPAFSRHHLVITSYATLQRDRQLFAGAHFTCIIGDEAQHIKNRRTQNAQALRALNGQARFLLTGTPVENSLEDLRSLFHFILPGYIEPSAASGRREERAWLDDRLQRKAAPYILRRTKAQVAPELPEKIEQVIYCELTPRQRARYDQMRADTEQRLMQLAASGKNEQQLRFAMLTELLRLRQICCDPRLAPGPAADGAELTAEDSGKLEAFRELFAEAIDDGHRLLVFSQFVSLLALLRAELDEQEIPYCYLDGATPPRNRLAEVDRFNQSPEIPIFLISLKAGGTGLNLTGADTVVHYDPWWNPAVEAQATDRAHRIGQTRVVTSYKMIASGTVEEKVLHMQAEKRRLLEAVFEASDALAESISLDDLRSLLKP